MNLVTPAATDLVPNVATLEQFARHAPVALRMVDVATGLAVTDRLVIEIAPQSGGNAVTAIPSRGGVWTAAGLPGLRRYEFGPDDSIAARRAAQRPFLITVQSGGGRYLPFSLNVLLPADELAVPLPGGPALPVSPWRDPLPASPPTPFAGLPLFPSAACRAPVAVGSINAGLRELGSGRPAAWALLQATIDGTVRGLGLADQTGRVQVQLPYPAPPPRVLTSPPAPAATRWSVTLAAFYIPAAGQAPAIPDLAAIMAQFAAPRRLLSDLASPPLELQAVELDEGVPLLLRSGTSAQVSPFLFLDVG